jgi:hypothetical protein
MDRITALRAHTGSLALLIGLSVAALPTLAQEPVVSQQFDGPPHYRLVCHQSGTIIEDQSLLDHVVLFTDNMGALRRIDYARGIDGWHTISVAAGMTCQVDPQR